MFGVVLFNIVIKLFRNAARLRKFVQCAEQPFLQETLKPFRRLIIEVIKGAIQKQIGVDSVPFRKPFEALAAYFGAIPRYRNFGTYCMQCRGTGK
jgi:hypothetical protein